MKKICFVCMVLVLVCNVTYSQNPQDTTTEKTKDVSNTEIPKNPFLTGDDEASEEDTAAVETLANPFLSEEETAATNESLDDAQEGGIDILVDLGLGVSLSRFFIEPKDISTKGKPSFIFNPGVIIPFAKRFYGGIALRYMQISVDLSLSNSSVDGSYAEITSKTNTNEIMTFLSVPVKLGMRFETPKITPYFYVDIEPAYLTGSNQFVSKEVRVIYPDGTEYFMPGELNSSDIKTTDYRERHQIFAGGGIGIEISYGYGFVYLDGCCQYALLPTDNPDFKMKIDHSVPYRSSSRVIYFPVSLGIRFYL